jgi:hypothetical protein
MFSKQIHRFFFLLGTATMAVSLPLSPFLLSLGQFILVFNWLFEWEMREKLSIFRKRPGILLILSIFIIHIVWLANTNNFDYALHDIKIKLPLLSLPIIFGTSRALNKKEFQYILHLFIAAILISTFISAYIYMGFGKLELIDSRKTSIFISHIRFALLVDLVCFILLGFIFYSKELILIPVYYYITLLFWFLFYALFIGAFSGVVIFLLVIPFWLLYLLKTIKNVKAIKLYAWSSLALILIILGYLSFSFFKFQSRTLVDLTDLPTYTLSGNPYKHDFKNVDYENSNRVWLFVCEKELEEQWNKRSTLDFKGRDLKKQLLETTLVRYLASLGYTKDSVGISKLNAQDIHMIEHGYTNHIFKNKWSVYPRLYELFWEVTSYIKSGNPSGHSLSQRFELSKNGLGVIRRHFWMGTGTGDVNDEVMLQYELDKSVLDSVWRFRPHNQYITFFIAFGAIGFSLMLILVTLGIYKERQHIDFIFIAFLLIALFSMISEDTLETQTGASFFAFFLSLLLLGRKLNT